MSRQSSMGERGHDCCEYYSTLVGSAHGRAGSFSKAKIRKRKSLPRFEIAFKSEVASRTLDVESTQCGVPVASMRLVRA